jgi:hypothetical protein
MGKCGGKAASFTLGEGQRKYEWLRTECSGKYLDLIGRLKEAVYEQLYNFIRTTKPRKMRWAKHVAHNGQ